MKVMNETSALFPRKLLDFFKRHSNSVSTEKALPLLEELYANLIGGHSSLPVDSAVAEVSVLRDSGVLGNESQARPLVLTEEGDLYFRRYFEYEESLAQRLVEWSKDPQSENAQVHHTLEQWLSGAPDQLAAAKLALHGKFAVITGGPGTGKTYLLVAIMAALLKQDPNISIVLAAAS